MMKMNLLITGAYKYTQTQINTLKEMFEQVDFLQLESDAVENPEKYDAVICNGLFLHNDIKKFANLKYIQLTSAGLDRVPLDYIKEKEISIYNARGVYSIPMAEYAILKILELYKYSKSFYINQNRHEWVKNRNILELSGKTAAIFGCGSVGIEVAKRLKAFGVGIIGVDIVKGKSEYIDKYELMSNMHEVLMKTDIVILTLPLTEDTFHLFDKSCFEKMKKNAVLINISRGQVINENDLILSLKSGKISAAALDVFEEEPLSVESELWDLENVIITPHNSFVGEGNNERMFDVIYNNLKGWMSYNENNGNIS